MKKFLFGLGVAVLLPWGLVACNSSSGGDDDDEMCCGPNNGSGGEGDSCWGNDDCQSWAECVDAPSECTPRCDGYYGPCGGDDDDDAGDDDAGDDDQAGDCCGPNNGSGGVGDDCWGNDDCQPWAECVGAPSTCTPRCDDFYGPC